ncbi:GNAT family N-acetyltransferase [Nocardioides stalactiti]|uniref:GNAT family N-acetyltransferase n=1 Tax=Nocardioides stalactiti TaxID=2755356 RepID=UPI00160399D0|nr:GNAT family N-acetyltransferase [Nocardioides stalactiti]
MQGLIIRDASPDDAVACAAIYGHYVETTVATFELTPPTVEEMAGRISACQAGHGWLVAEQDGQVAGFAYGTKFAERPAYRWAGEVSVYLAPAAQGSGLGTALYDVLVPRLEERGFQVLTARIAQPNDASMALHARFGFEQAGLLRRIGFKHGRWVDVAILQRDLAPPTDSPVEPS